MPDRRPPSNRTPREDGPAPRQGPEGNPFGVAVLALGLLLATLAAYGPSLTGGVVWDDDAHLTRPDLRSVDGLKRIWTDVSATQQYYPLLHSAFWLEHRLWGDATLGYHLTNVFLHVLAATLLALLWSRIGAPGGWLAAALFALHPVAVESVAWISEQKNTLSTVLYLVAALAFLSFRESRAVKAYAFGSAAFLAALLTKSVTATLPAALLVIVWWRFGKVSWRRDVLPLVPWFALAAGMAVLTVSVERHVVGARGAEWALGPGERILVAGRALWFYLGKLAWPADLAFIYPRWRPDTLSLAQWIFPAAALLALASLWGVRTRSRAPIAVALLFAGSLFPALGFFDVYPFRYSFVANHFQYLGSAYVLAGAATGLAVLSARGRASASALRVAGCLLLPLLGGLTYREARNYRDAETLYRSILESDARSWFAHHNLAMGLLDRGRPEEALPHFEAALRANANAPEIRIGLGLALSRVGREGDAIGLYESVGRSHPESSDAESNLGELLRRMGRVDEAIVHLERAVRLEPRHEAARHNLGLALGQAGRWEEAARHLAAALEIRPDRAETWYRRGLALSRLGRREEAIDSFRHALEQHRRHPEAENALGLALAGIGRQDEAIAHLSAAVRLSPEDAALRLDLGGALLDAGRIEEALPELESAVRRAPASAFAHDRLGVALARQGRLRDAVARFEDAVRLDPDEPRFRFDLALALMRSGDRAAARVQLERALASDPAHGPARTLLASLTTR
ncbi:Magnetosome protein MamA [Gammaproteobacteria bacterium]|nr:Magnetosome protein MamA [Gammaproteobacteria bacterium]